MKSYEELKKHVENISSAIARMEERLDALERKDKSEDVEGIIETVRHIEDFLNYRTRGFYERSKSR